MTEIYEIKWENIWTLVSGSNYEKTSFYKNNSNVYLVLEEAQYTNSGHIVYSSNTTQVYIKSPMNFCNLKKMI